MENVYIWCNVEIIRKKSSVRANIKKKYPKSFCHFRVDFMNCFAPLADISRPTLKFDATKSLRKVVHKAIKLYGVGSKPVNQCGHETQIWKNCIIAQGLIS